MKQFILAAIITLTTNTITQAEIKGWGSAAKNLQVGTNVEVTYIKDNGNQATIKGLVLDNNEKAIQIGFFPIRYEVILHNRILGISILAEDFSPELLLLDLLDQDGKIVIAKFGPPIGEISIGPNTKPKNPLVKPRRRKKPLISHDQEKELFNPKPSNDNFNFDGYRKKKKGLFGLF